MDGTAPGRLLADLRLPAPPPFTQGSIDRHDDRRPDVDWLAAAWASPQARVVVVDAGRLEVDAAGALRWRSPDEADQDADRYFLGAAGPTSWFAVASELPDGAPTAGLRELAQVLDADQAGLAVHAVSLANWHAAHPRCPRCGAPTVPVPAGHVRVCTEDGSEHFPRTDPAVIVLVVDEAGRALLGRHARFTERRFSTLAGFVEPGESLEQAVRREIHEEAGVVVGAVQYAGSQPWPFPSSLMIGFYATAADTEITVDRTEIAEAAWFSREQLAAEIAAGTLDIPGPMSISRALLDGWYGSPIPEP